MKKTKPEKIKEFSLRQAFVKSCKSVGLITPTELTGERKKEWEKIPGALDIPDFFFNFLVNQFEDENYKYDKKIISIYDAYEENFGYAIINVDDNDLEYKSTLTIVTKRKDVSRVLFMIEFIHSEMSFLFNRHCVIRVCCIGENTSNEIIEKYKGFKSDFIVSFNNRVLFGENGGKLLDLKHRNFAIENVKYPNLKNGLMDLRTYRDFLLNSCNFKIVTPIDLIYNEFYMRDKIPETNDYSTNYKIYNKELDTTNYGYDKYGLVLPITPDELNEENKILDIVRYCFGDNLYKYTKKELMDRFSLYLCIYKPDVDNGISLKNYKFDEEAYRNHLYLIKNETSLILDKLMRKTS